MSCFLTYYCSILSQNGVYWLRSQIQSNSKYRTDDTRFWIDGVSVS